MPVCPNCGNQAAENAIFCDQCGTRLPTAAEPPAETAVAAEAPGAPAEAPAGSVPEGVLICPSCGAENVPGEVFCDVCGEPLEAPEPVASEAVVAAEGVPEAAPEAEVEVELETVLEPEPEVEVETVLEAEIEEEPVAAAEPAAGAGAYCPVCGASISAGDTFCGTCGASLTEAAEEQAIVEEPAFAEVEAEEAVLVEGEPPPEPVVVEEEPVAETVVVEEEPVAETVIAEEAPGEEEAVPEVAAAEDKCPVCGANVVPGQRFCASCGAALPVAGEAVPAPEGPAPEAVPAPAEALPAPAEALPAPAEALPAPAEALPAAEPAAPPPSAGPYLEVVDSGAHIPLVDQPELLIGRTDDISGIYPDVDMTPHGGEEGGVSRRHAQLIHLGDSWYVVDLDSTNGTYVNGTEIAPQVQVPVQDGDRISLGDAELVFHAP